MATGFRQYFKLRKLLNTALNRRIRREFASSAVLLHNQGSHETKKTHFGFQTVSEAEKEEKVHEVFKNVAEKYDLMNDAMSVGIHRLWKDAFIRRLSPSPGIRLIDVAGGTGSFISIGSGAECLEKIVEKEDIACDIAFRCLDYVHSLRPKNTSRDPNTESTDDIEYNMTDPLEYSIKNIMDNDGLGFESDRENDPSLCHVTVCDINQSMLDVGKERALELGIYSGLSWVKGNAESLPFEDNSFDAYTIAFGIRNCTHIDQVVKEAYRVVKPGGRFMCLEFSHVSNPIFRSIYDDYSFQVIPVLGQILAADWKSYQYLVESIRQFPNQEDFKDIIKGAGFSAVTYENLTFGVVAIHSGFKL